MLELEQEAMEEARRAVQRAAQAKALFALALFTQYRFREAAVKMAEAANFDPLYAEKAADFAAAAKKYTKFDKNP
jgi:hypothetical protein